MAVTVVVATRNRRASLLRSLARLVELPERPSVVVVDNGSADGTVEAVRREHPGVEVVALDRNLGAAARNEGVRRARTETVAFSDDDSWWAPGALARAEEVFAAHPRLGLAAARILVGERGEEDPTCGVMAKSPLRSVAGLPGPRVLGFVACGAVVRREAFLEAGGFDRRLLFVGEEQLLAVDLARHGWELAYVPELVAFHHPSPARDDGRRRRLEARNDLWFAWLRRRPLGALVETARIVRGGNGAALRGGLDAVRGLPWVVRDRRPVPAPLEAELRALDAGRRVERRA